MYYLTPKWEEDISQRNSMRNLWCTSKTYIYIYKLYKDYNLFNFGFDDPERGFYLDFTFVFSEDWSVERSNLIKWFYATANLIITKRSGGIINKDHRIRVFTLCKMIMNKQNHLGYHILHRRMEEKITEGN